MEKLITSVIDYIKTECIKKGIPYKENSKNLIIECPVCKFRDNKPNKIKFYISKEIDKPLVFHCFRCQTKGNVFKLQSILKKYYNIDLTNVIELGEFIELNTQTNLSKSITNNSIGLAEYIVNLKVEDILNFEFNYRVPLIQDTILFSENELNLLEFENDEPFILKNIEQYLKSGYLYEQYIKQKRNFSNLLTFEFHNCSWLFKYIKEKTLFYPSSLFKEYSNRIILKNFKFLNRLIFLTTLNEKYYARYIGEQQKNNIKRYLYPRKINIDNKVYEPLIESDMFFYSSKLENELLRLNEKLIIENTEKYLEFNNSINQYILEKINSFNDFYLLQQEHQENFTNTKKVIQLENLYVFEGIFDSLKFLDFLTQLLFLSSPNKDNVTNNNFKFTIVDFLKHANTIAVGGLNNFKNVLLFLRTLIYYLQLFTNLRIQKLKIKNLIFIFDGDLNEDKQILPIAEFIENNLYHFNKLRKQKIETANKDFLLYNDFVDNLEIQNIKFFKFPFIRLDNFHSIKDIAELLDLNQFLNIFFNYFL
jgi:hypothetical protein